MFKNLLFLVCSIQIWAINPPHFTENSKLKELVIDKTMQTLLHPETETNETLTIEEVLARMAIFKLNPLDYVPALEEMLETSLLKAATLGQSQAIQSILHLAQSKNYDFTTFTCSFEFQRALIAGILKVLPTGDPSNNLKNLFALTSLETQALLLNNPLCPQYVAQGLTVLIAKNQINELKVFWDFCSGKFTLSKTLLENAFKAGLLKLATLDLAQLNLTELNQKGANSLTAEDLTNLLNFAKEIGLQLQLRTVPDLKEAFEIGLKKLQQENQSITWPIDPEAIDVFLRKLLEKGFQFNSLASYKSSLLPIIQLLEKEQISVAPPEPVYVTLRNTFFKSIQLAIAASLFEVIQPLLLRAQIDGLNPPSLVSFPGLSGLLEDHFQNNLRTGSIFSIKHCQDFMLKNQFHFTMKKTPELEAAFEQGLAAILSEKDSWDTKLKQLIKFAQENDLNFDLPAKIKAGLLKKIQTGTPEEIRTILIHVRDLKYPLQLNTIPGIQEAAQSALTNVSLAMNESAFNTRLRFIQAQYIRINLKKACEDAIYQSILNGDPEQIEFLLGLIAKNHLSSSIVLALVNEIQSAFKAGHQKCLKEKDFFAAEYLKQLAFDNQVDF